MNHQDSRSVTTAGKTFSPTALALAVALALGCWNSAALAASNPIPGVDIIVRKKPDGIVVTPTSDHSGKFSVRLKEPGNYTLSTACSTGGCPPIALSINVAGKALKPDADGAADYEFTVGQGGLDLGGQIFVRGAQPIIVNGKSVTPQGRFDDTDIVHVLPGTVKLQQPPPSRDGGEGAKKKDKDWDEAVGDLKKKTEEVSPPGPRAASTIPIVTLPDGSHEDGSQEATTRGITTPVGLEGEDGKIDPEPFDDSNPERDMPKVTPRTPSKFPPGGNDGAASQATGDVISDLGQVSTTSGITSPVGLEGEDGKIDPEPFDDSNPERDMPKVTPRTPSKFPPGGPPDGGDVKPGIFGAVTAGNAGVGGIAAENASPPDGGEGAASQATDDVNAAFGQVSTTRGIATPPGGGDKELPGVAWNAGDVMNGVPIELEGDPGSVKASTTTDAHGAFHFDKLPAGKYKLTIRGEPPISLSVGDDGIAGGTVMRGPDGSMSIFDRWDQSGGGARRAQGAKKKPGDQTAGSKAAESPVGFGSGNNAMGAGPGAGLGAGPGMSPPGAAMGGAGPMSPMSPGAGPVGPGGPMGGARP